MTIITVLVIPEGIVLGSDTQTTIFVTEKYNSGKERTVPVNFFRNSQKIFDLSVKNKNVFVLSQFGIANPGGKPLSYHIFTIRELLEQKIEDELNSVKKVSEIIINHFKQFDETQTRGLGFYLSGFDKEEEKVIPCVHIIQFLKKENDIYEINNKEIKRVLSQNDYGMNWAGEGSWIISKLLKLSDKTLKIPATAISFHLLSLKDGVEFTEYIINAVIGFEKFQSRFPTCGGKARIAILTPREFKFINQEDSDLLI